MLTDYLKYISKFNQIILQHLVKEDELKRIINADLHWVKNFKKPTQDKDINVGDVFYFEFGKNMYPEMSYEHRGIVIGKSFGLLYVLPIFSYHQYMNKDIRNKRLCKMLVTDYDFLTRDSVVSLYDICTISPRRIKYEKLSHIAASSPFFKQVTESAFSRCFTTYHYEYRQMQHKLNTK